MALRVRLLRLVTRILRIGDSSDHFFGSRRRSPNAARGEFEAQSRYWNGF